MVKYIKKIKYFFRHFWEDYPKTYILFRIIIALPFVVCAVYAGLYIAFFLMFVVIAHGADPMWGIIVMYTLPFLPASFLPILISRHLYVIPLIYFFFICLPSFVIFLIRSG